MLRDFQLKIYKCFFPKMELEIMIIFPLVKKLHWYWIMAMRVEAFDAVFLNFFAIENWG